MNIPLTGEAIQLARRSVAAGGGPFAALIVKSGDIVASGTNSVTSTNDPTAHAEIVAIRNACRTMASFQLGKCEIYCSCEPCPMCLGAIYWARIERVYFVASARDAESAGFDDSAIRKQLLLPYDMQGILIKQLQHEDSWLPFRDWQTKTDRVPY